MNLHSSRASRPAWQSAWGLSLVASAVFVALLMFVLGNAVAVYALVSGYHANIRQISTLDEVRTLSQRLAVQAMRLSDGSYIQTARLSHDTDLLESTLQALNRGGVVAGTEISALSQPDVRDGLSQVRRDWRAMRARLQSVILDSYARDDDAHGTPLGPPGALQRQWVGDAAQTLLTSLDTVSDRLSARLSGARERLLYWCFSLAAVDLLLLLGMFLWLQRSFVQPLRDLQGVAKAWLDGRYEGGVPARGDGELAVVSQAFAVGAARVQTLHGQFRDEETRLQRSDLVFKGLAQNSLVGIFLAEDECFSFVSQKMADIFGYEIDEMTASMPLLGIVMPRERYLVAEAIKASRVRRDGTLRFERQGRRKDGTPLDIEVFGTVVVVDDRISIIGLVQDVTERKQAESSAQLAGIAYENSSEAIAITNASGVIIDVNPAYSRMTGYWADEVAGQMLPLLQPGRHNRAFYDEMWHTINTKGRWSGEYWGQRKSGEQYAQRAVVDTAWNHDGSVNCRVAMLSDVTQKKQIEAQIWNQAHHDPLTGLPNRQYFNEQLQAAVDASDETGQPLALLFLDLDLFKEVNDSLGHAVGDRLLIEVAGRLRTSLGGDSCFVARLGGDEFVLIVSDAPERARIDALCCSILDQITQPYELNGHAVHVSASLGVALYPQDAEDAGMLLRYVDMAMYAAKDSGRDSYRYFDPSMRERVRMLST